MRVENVRSEASQLLMKDPSKPVVPSSLWLGSYAALDALITGNIRWSRSFTLYRAHSPFTFWLCVLFAIALAIFGTRWEIRNRDAFWEDGEIVRRKIFLSIGLFFFLLLVYASFLFNFFAGGIVPDPFANMGLFLKPCVTAAFPFAVLAYVDKHWTSNDAAPVCAGGWLAASPWVLGYASAGAGAWSADLLGGLALVVLGAAALRAAQPRQPHDAAAAMNGSRP